MKVETDLLANGGYWSDIRSTSFGQNVAQEVTTGLWTPLLPNWSAGDVSTENPGPLLDQELQAKVFGA